MIEKKRRISRKSKKWHKKRGWTIHFTADGRAYFSHDYGPFRAEMWRVTP